MLILAALHAETSLRGMWLHPKGTRRQDWHELWWPLSFGSPQLPTLTTIWNLVGTLDAVDGSVSAGLSVLLGHPTDGVSADSKVLQGSRRADVPGV